MSTVTLMQGDCCEKLNGIPANSVNLVLADPPYGITHQAWDTVLPFEDFIMKDGKPKRSCSMEMSMRLRKRMLCGNAKSCRKQENILWSL